MTASFAASSPRQTLPLLATTLMKGVIYRADDARLWSVLARDQALVRDYVATIGLDLIIDDSEGYAYLRSKPDPEGEEADKLPRLVQRRALTLHASVLLVLLRKRLMEFDTKEGGTRLVLTRTELVEMMRGFLPTTASEVRAVELVEAGVNQAVRLGYLRKLANSNPKAEDSYEVLRILKAFVDAQWLNDFHERLQGYRQLFDAPGAESDDD